MLQTNRPDEGIETKQYSVFTTLTNLLQTNRPDEGIETYIFDFNKCYFFRYKQTDLMKGLRLNLGSVKPFS